MKNYVFKKSATIRVRCIMLALLAIVFISAFIPLWQLGVENTIRCQMLAYEKTLTELDGEERALVANNAIEEAGINSSISYITTASL